MDVVSKLPPSTIGRFRKLVEADLLFKDDRNLHLLAAIAALDEDRQDAVLTELEVGLTPSLGAEHA